MENKRNRRMRKKLLLKKEVTMRRRRMSNKKRRKMNSIMNMEESMERKEMPNRIMKMKVMTLIMVSTTKTSSLSSFLSCSSNGMQISRCNLT